MDFPEENKLKLIIHWLKEICYIDAKELKDAVEMLRFISKYHQRRKCTKQLRVGILRLIFGAYKCYVPN